MLERATLEQNQTINGQHSLLVACCMLSNIHALAWLHMFKQGAKLGVAVVRSLLNIGSHIVEETSKCVVKNPIIMGAIRTGQLRLLHVVKPGSKYWLESCQNIINITLELYETETPINGLSIEPNPYHCAISSKIELEIRGLLGRLYLLIRLSDDNGENIPKTKPSNPI
jgi:hypothetical protein